MTAGENNTHDVFDDNDIIDTGHCLELDHELEKQYRFQASKIPLLYSNGLDVTVFVHSHKVKFTVDEGSMGSVISVDTVNKLGLMNDVEPISGLSLTDVNGKPLSILGTVDISIQLRFGGEKCSLSFFVTQLPVHLLGMSAIYELQLSRKMRGNLVYLESGTTGDTIRLNLRTHEQRVQIRKTTGEVHDEGEHKTHGEGPTVYMDIEDFDLSTVPDKYMESLKNLSKDSARLCR